MTPPVERLADDYAALFDEKTRAAHLVCLSHARVVRGRPRPTVADCLTFAALYEVDGAALAAFFGHLGWRERGRTIYVDTSDGDASPHAAQQLMTQAQARAFGFYCTILGGMAV